MQNSSYYFIFTPRSLFIIQSHCKSEVEYQTVWWVSRQSSAVTEGDVSSQSSKSFHPTMWNHLFPKSKAVPRLWCYSAVINLMSSSEFMDVERIRTRQVTQIRVRISGATQRKSAPDTSCKTQCASKQSEAASKIHQGWCEQQSNQR